MIGYRVRRTLDDRPRIGVKRLRIAAFYLVGAAAVVAGCLLLTAAPAWAQKDSILTVGVAASIYDATDPHVDNPVGVGLVARLRRSSGIGVTVGLDWFKSDVHGDIGGVSTPLASLRIRPVMAGIALTRQYSQFAISGSLVVGYSFNSISSTGAAEAAYARIGRPGTTFDISNCLAYRPDFSIWWELGNHFGLLTSVSYMGARPALITTSPSGVSRSVVNVSAPMVTLGVAYGIF
jgi:hypothetical protein